jgi:dihydropteroate synthase
LNPAPTWSIGDGDVDLTPGVLVGVVNVTPDSFSDGGEHLDPTVAIQRGLELVAQGATLVDVGGESTRPGARAVDLDTEMQRIMPVVEGLVAAGVRVSVDTYKPEVGRRALGAGAVVLNDVTGFRDDAMVELAAESDCGLVVMHMRGTPLEMHLDPRYDDVVGEVEQELLERVDVLESAGVDRDRVAIDPGLGFGKRARHSLNLLRHVDRLAGHGLPVMIGASRKGFVARIVGDVSRDARDETTAVITALSYTSGARLFRVHDVARSWRALRVAGAIVADQEWEEWLQD